MTRVLCCYVPGTLHPRAAAALATLLDHHHDHVLWIIGRREAGIPGVVAFACDMGRACLAGDSQRVFAKNAVGRSSRRRGGLAQGVTNEGQVAARDVQIAGRAELQVLRAPALGRLDTQAQVRRHEVAAVGDGRVVDGCLQWRGQPGREP